MGAPDKRDQVLGGTNRDIPVLNQEEVFIVRAIH
jgi:hypothetical protein